MLHARARNALHLFKLRALLFQPLENKINGFEEERDGREDLALGGVGENTLLNAMVREIGVEVDFGFVDQFQVGADYNAWSRCVSRVVGGVASGGASCTLELLRAEIEAQELVGHGRGRV